MATATNTTIPSKIDRASVMRAAWASYRRFHALQESIHGARAFDRNEFRFKLQLAWRDAKLAAMSEIERRREAIRSEIDGLKFKSFQIDTEPTRARLTAELSALAA